jgi:hypothetical protein
MHVVAYYSLVAPIMSSLGRKNLVAGMSTDEREDFLSSCSATPSYVLAPFSPLKQLFFFISLTLYNFESETWQFTVTFDIEYGKNSLKKSWHYI